MQINYNNEGKFEKLYPITLSENVKLNNGKNVEEWKMEVDDDFNNIEHRTSELEQQFENSSINDSLWSGNSLLDSTDVITPTKKLEDCKNGWLLMFKYVGAYNNLSYKYIPKHHLTVGNSGGVKLVLGSANGTYVQKYVYIKSKTITGYSANSTNGNEKIELFNVYEY